MSNNVFTVREMEIIELAKAGCSYTETALILNVTKSLVQFRIRIIIAKMRARTLPHAIIKGIQEGIIPLKNRGV